MTADNGRLSFSGRLVRLKALDPAEAAPYAVRWGRNAAYQRLLNSDPPRLWSVPAVKDWLEKGQREQGPAGGGFLIETLQEPRVIGFVDLEGISWLHGDAWVGIGIGDPEDWSLGYGTDAMQVLLRYAFQELNLFRVSLTVFSYNERAVRSYEKAGFVHEGRARRALRRDGRWWDLIFMGILRPEWAEVQ
jgi:RimJ/RimL family protein N-acetyltransferase